MSINSESSLWQVRKGRVTIGTKTQFFCLAQVLSGHGCFDKYLCRGRKPTAECYHCGCVEDMTRWQKTTSLCQPWQESWSSAIVSFCIDAVSQKEAAEREKDSSLILSSVSVWGRRLANCRRDSEPCVAKTGLLSLTHVHGLANVSRIPDIPLTLYPNVLVSTDEGFFPGKKGTKTYNQICTSFSPYN